MNTPSKDSSGFSKLLDACIHCGFCLPACPTYRLTGSEAESPRGRIYLMRQWQEARLSADDIQAPLDDCLGCLSCQTACPSGVQYDNLLMQAREAMAPKTHHPFRRGVKRMILRWILPNQTFLRWIRRGLRLTQWLKLDRWLLSQPWIETVSSQLHHQGAPHVAQWLKLAPVLSPKQSWLSRPLTEGSLFEPPEGIVPNGQTVALFLGCVMNAMFSGIHEATVHVLLAQGFRVAIPAGQTCCGALAYHAGETDIARPLAEKNIAAFLQPPPQTSRHTLLDASLLDTSYDWIVLNSAGCGAALKSLPHWLKTPEAQSLSDRVIDVMALLAKSPLAPMRPQRAAQTVTYHAACHLHHAQGVQSEPLSILNQVPNLTLVPLKDAALCCGSAGVYNLEHPDLANGMLAEKIHHVLATKADGVVSGNPGCLLQLQMGLRQAASAMTACHPIEILADAYSS
ncbi:MAG: (Fe-S)-binding protein [Vampirovibrionales bacterium]|nr:(Fe-S)-binding protein [Vampirovibrionales bacterium]